MQRYYGQNYDRLDDPDWNPQTSPSQSAANLPAYEPYSSRAGEPPVKQPNQQLPSTYLNNKYPQGSGLKSKVAFWQGWPRRKMLIFFGGIGAGILILIIIIAVAVSVSSSSGVHYHASSVKVTNEKAFQSGGASRSQSNHKGIGAGKDEYTYYKGDASNFPPASEWVSFQNMWTNNRPTIAGSCSTLNDGSDDTSQEINYIYDAIQNRSKASLVDHRFVFAIILQESQGCVHVKSTTSSGGVSNRGLMQSHNGAAFNADNAQLSILQMVQDGTQGTHDGPGLAQLLNTYGNPYEAARVYNSGKIPAGGDLSQAAGATACYVSDVANRLTGWTTAPNQCPQEKGST